MTMAADARPTVYPARECSTTYGIPKVGFPDRRTAQRVRRARRVLEQHIYRCSSCQCWHLGHRP